MFVKKTITIPDLFGNLVLPFVLALCTVHDSLASSCPETTDFEQKVQYLETVRYINQQDTKELAPTIVDSGGAASGQELTIGTAPSGKRRVLW